MKDGGSMNNTLLYSYDYFKYELKKKKNLEGRQVRARRRLPHPTAVRPAPYGCWLRGGSALSGPKETGDEAMAAAPPEWQHRLSPQRSRDEGP